MAFEATTASMFTPEELFETLGIPFAEVVNIAHPVDVADQIVFGVVNADEIHIATGCPHCAGHLVQATVPGSELSDVLVNELGFVLDIATTIVRALYWLPAGTIFSVPLDLVRLPVRD